MAHWTPLIGNLTGKVGAIVIQKNGVVRLNRPGVNRVPSGVKAQFATLAKQWPFSEVGYKTAVQESPGVAMGIGCLTRYAYKFEAGRVSRTDSYTVDTAGLLPDPIVAQAPGYDPMSDLIIDHVAIQNTGLSKAFYIWTTVTVPTAGEALECYFLMFDSDLGVLRKTRDLNAGVRAYTCSRISDSFYRVLVNIPNDDEMTGWALALWGTSSATGLATVYGYASGVRLMVT